VIDELAQRINHAAESILENEALTADLDDVTAQALLDWGVACARMIAQGTEGLNDVEAENVMSPRLRAIRRLMRQVDQWIPQRREADVEASAALLTRIIAQATVIYGGDFIPPNSAQQDAFLRRNLAAAPEEIITRLRALIDGAG
jgi:hypothetical protein